MRCSYLLDTDRFLQFRFGYVEIVPDDVVAIERVLPLIGGWYVRLHMVGGGVIRVTKNDAFERFSTAWWEHQYDLARAREQEAA